MENLVSLNRKISVAVTEEDGRIFYEIYENGEVKFEKSPLGISVGKNQTEYEDYSVNNKIKSVAFREIKNRKFIVYGRQEQREENCIEYTVTVSHLDLEYKIVFKVFDNGVAFRYIFNKEQGLFVFSESTEFSLPKESKVYATFGCRNPNCNTKLNGYDALCYESTYAEYDPKERFTPTEYVREKDCLTNEEHFNYVLFPMTIKYKDGSFGALMESEVYNYLGSNLYPFGGYRFGLNTVAGGGRFKAFEVKDCVKTPWRVCALGKTLNELYNNGIIDAVVEKSGRDFSFVNPGRSAWHWHVQALWGNWLHAVGGYEMLEEYTKTAGKLGFEYNIFDEGWQKIYSEKDGKALEYKESVRNLVELGKKYGVWQVLWTGFIHNYMNHTNFYEKGSAVQSVKEILDEISSLGAAGAKVDFFRSESDIYAGVNMYEYVLDYCAEKGLVCDLHGSTKPTGLSAKFPNELSREGIRGMENYKYNTAYYPDIAYGFTTLTFVRGIAGHGDWTPFVADGIGLATILLTDSPLNAISATCEELLTHPAKELIKSMPTSFTKTVVLPESEFGKFISMAKEKDGNWWIAGINNTDKPIKQTIKFGDYFGKGDFQYELWTDTDRGLYRTFDQLQDKHSITIEIPPYRGYAGRVSRLALNYYGGEITDKVILKEWSGGEIYYTLDDSDPENSNTRIRQTKPIKLERSCYLRACLIKDGQVLAKLRYRFNKIEN